MTFEKVFCGSIHHLGLDPCCLRRPIRGMLSVKEGAELECRHAVTSKQESSAWWVSNRCHQVLHCGSPVEKDQLVENAAVTVDKLVVIDCTAHRNMSARVCLGMAQLQHWPISLLH